MRRALIGLVVAASLAGCGVLSPPVVRTVDGVSSEGRFIEPDAYALYAVAALREAHSRLRFQIQPSIALRIEN